MASFCVLLFLCSLIVLYRRERKKGGPIRHGRIWWKAFTIATFLWIPIALVKCCCSRKRKDAAIAALPGGPTSAGAYTKIEGGSVQDVGGAGNQWYGAPPSKYEPFSTAGPNGGMDTGYRQQTPVPPPPYTAPPAAAAAAAPAPVGLAAEYYAPSPAAVPYSVPPTAAVPYGMSPGYHPGR